MSQAYTYLWFSVALKRVVSIQFVKRDCCKISPFFHYQFQISTAHSMALPVTNAELSVMATTWNIMKLWLALQNFRKTYFLHPPSVVILETYNKYKLFPPSTVFAGDCTSNTSARRWGCYLVSTFACESWKSTRWSKETCYKTKRKKKFKTNPFLKKWCYYKRSSFHRG